MPKLMSVDQIEQYRRDGYVSPLSAFSIATAAAYRKELEAGERTHGLAPDQRRKMHLYLAWVDEIAHHPRILDAVGDLILLEDIKEDAILQTLKKRYKQVRTDATVTRHLHRTGDGRTAESLTACTRSLGGV